MRGVDRSRADGIAGLDGLRALAATAVLVVHVAQRSQPGSPMSPLAALLMVGAQGLTLFFVLSGFLLYRPFAAALLGTRPMPSIRRYARGRLLRIYPAYLTVYLLSAFVFGVASIHTPQWHAMSVGRPTDPLQVLADLLLVQTLVPAQMGTGIAPAWSLTTELTFYALLPVLAAALLVAGRRSLPAVRAAAPPLVLIAIGSVTSLVLMAAGTGLHGEAQYRFDWGPTASAVLGRSLLVQGALFGFGMAVAWAVERLRQQRRLSISPVQRIAVVAAAFALIIRGTVAGAQFGTETVGAGCALLILAVVLGRPDGRISALGKALDVAPLRALGAISYSTYLWHSVVIAWLASHGATLPGDAGLLMNAVLVFAVTVPLAWATYVLVERPAMRWSRRRRSREGGLPRRRAAAFVSVQLPEPDLAPVAFHREHSNGPSPGPVSVQRRSP